MTSILHPLRTRSRALAQGLVLVLLASWLALVCPHCLVQAAEVSPAPEHCHSEAPAPADTPADAHACCEQAPVCTGAGCAQMSSVVGVEPVAYSVAGADPHAPPVTRVASDAYPAAPPAPPPLVQRATADPCPLYLRHCTFLN
ncbi:MAG: hypothetical protein ABR553_08150 [Gammaproteobacteria bacterium]